MIILVAAILTTAALFLKPLQERNKRIEKMQDILSAANITADASNADVKYNESIIREILVTMDGEEHSIFEDGEFTKGDQRAFDVNMKFLMKRIEAYEEGEEEAEMPLLPIFHMRSDDGSEVYVIPVRGKGLWGPVWGNLAFGTDLNTIVGAAFDHQAETPGLGAEINQDFFEKQFIGKKIFSENGEFKSVAVVKGGVANSTDVEMIHGVDAISGGTITSNGVTAMLNDCLENYVTYIQKNQD
jgi:Na+-transporting NADH:ubiquinone oxidoreductase subunit C